MGDKLRIGLIGTGFGVNVHLPTYVRRDDVEVTCVCSAQLARAEQAAHDFGVPAFTDDYRELIARDDVDLVDITTPPALHTEMVSASVEADKHVLCEKPITLDSAQARELVELVSGSERLHAVNHEMRYLPARRLIRDLIAQGFVGQLEFVSGRVHAPHGVDPTKEPFYFGWISESRKGGGFLMASFSHHIDLARYCFGEITDVKGRTTALVGERPILAFEYRDGDPIGPDSPTTGFQAIDVDDTVVFSGSIGTGGLISMSGGWSLYHPSGVDLEIHGDEGAIRLRHDGKVVGARRDETEFAEIPTRAVLPSYSDLTHVQYLVPAFSAMIGDIAGTILGRVDPAECPFATFEDGLRLMEIIDAIRGGVPARLPSRPHRRP